MSTTAKTTIVIKFGSKLLRVAKVLIGSDGSYYATAPFHKNKDAVVWKMTVDYDAGNSTTVASEAIIDMASLDGGQLKLTHHRDGFVQFSGLGVLSGRDADGNIRGIGIMSSPLDEIFRGPAFGYGIKSLDWLEEVIGGPKSTDLVLDIDDFGFIPRTNGVMIEAHYFTPRWRRFIRRNHRGQQVLSVQHPAGPNLELRVFLAADECRFPGFLGFEMYTWHFGEGFPENGFSFSGPSGNGRYNELGHRVGDALFCMSPRDMRMPVHRSITFPFS